MHWASAWNPALVPILIEAGSEVNLLCDGQDSPLCFAASERKDRSAVAALMAAGADPHLGDSPLKYSGVSKGMKRYIRSLSK